MDRKTLSGLIILVIAMGFGVGMYLHHNNKLTPETVAQAQNVSSRIRPECKVNNSSFKIDSDDENNIQLAAVSHLTNVPAGTTADVNISSYTSSAVIGSVIYPKDYGTYNFKMAKINASANEIPWQITSFVTCKQ